MVGNQPKEYDAVLGGQLQVPADGVVLAGIKGVKKRLAQNRKSYIASDGD